VATVSSQVWRLDDAGPRRLRILAATQHQVTSADLAPDGETALVYAADGTSSLWRLAGPGDPPAVAALPLGRIRVTGVAAPSGTTHLVVTAAGGAVTVWDVGDAAHPRRLSATGPRDGAGTLRDVDRPSSGTDTSRTAFSPDGRWFAATDGAGGIGVWTVDPDGRLRRTGSIPRTGEDRVGPLALSPDGPLLAVRPSEQDPDRAEPVTLWDIGDDPRPVGRLPATDRSPAMTFAPDGRTWSPSRRTTDRTR
jgi:WD40 repeat protein